MYNLFASCLQDLDALRDEKRNLEQEINRLKTELRKADKTNTELKEQLEDEQYFSVSFFLSPSSRVIFYTRSLVVGRIIRVIVTARWIIIVEEICWTAYLHSLCSLFDFLFTYKC